MVSVLKIGPSLAFNAKNQNISLDKPIDKAKIKSVANAQVSLGCAAVGAGALAVAGSFIKKGVLKYIAPIPAAAIGVILGANMIVAGNAVKKVVNTPNKISKV